jgi:hypothetical protein
MKIARRHVAACTALALGLAAAGFPSLAILFAAVGLVLAVAWAVVSLQRDSMCWQCGRRRPLSRAMVCRDCIEESKSAFYRKASER